jgi:hypothetical protein
MSIGAGPLLEFPIMEIGQEWFKPPIDTCTNWDSFEISGGSHVIWVACAVAVTSWFITAKHRPNTRTATVSDPTCRLVADAFLRILSRDSHAQRANPKQIAYLANGEASTKRHKPTQHAKKNGVMNFQLEDILNSEFICLLLVAITWGGFVQRDQLLLPIPTENLL